MASTQGIPLYINPFPAMNPFHCPHALESCVAKREEGSLLKVTPLSDTGIQNQASMNIPYTFMTQIKIDLHTSLSVTAFHSAQERSRAPKLLTPTIISIVQLATFQNQDHLKNKRPTTIQTYLFKKS
jgi:hypothetical protein